MFNDFYLLRFSSCLTSFFVLAFIAIESEIGFLYSLPYQISTQRALHTTVYHFNTYFAQDFQVYNMTVIKKTFLSYITAAMILKKLRHIDEKSFFLLSLISFRSAIRIDDKHERLWLNVYKRHMILTIRYESQTGMNGGTTSVTLDFNGTDNDCGKGGTST